VLAHSPLTGSAAWGKLPTLLREQAHKVVVINVQDDDEPPFAERYLMRARIQIGTARAGPSYDLGRSQRRGPAAPADHDTPAQSSRAWEAPAEVARPGGYVFLDAGI
jgi:hypothetical protein